ncbi:MAG: prolipoprotein diacylglyceryl transferase [Patescibacteria group bacterium]|nr:prolipoprotein diacylglyceryl transferase [Patescibacteria group bacterium]
MSYFWQNYLPQPLLFSFGPFNVHWYGLIMVLAMLAAAVYAFYSFKKSEVLSAKKAEDLIFYLIIFGLLGARFGHVFFFNFDYYFDNPADIVKVWQGGMSIQGALVFAALTLLIWSVKNKVSFLALGDRLVPAVALGQVIGRWGNYFNQELYGQPASWGIPINPINRVSGYENYNFFQPAFFYESILCLVLFFLLHSLLKVKLAAGRVFFVYLIFYGLIRFFMETVRIDETPDFFGWRLPQLIALLLPLLFLAGLYFLPKLKK